MHRHEAADCAAAFDAWTGFESPLQSGRPPATCRHASHTQTWVVEADSATAAVELLPAFVRDRTDAIEIR